MKNAVVLKEMGLKRKHEAFSMYTPTLTIAFFASLSVVVKSIKEHATCAYQKKVSKTIEPVN